MSTCDPNRGCPPSVPNVHCAYPKCAHGEAKNPTPVSATEPERRTYDPVGALISLPCYVCGKEERERPMTLSDKWRHEDPNDCITFLRARLVEAERVTEATRDTVREEFKQILCDDTSSYPRIIYPSNDVCDEIVRLRAALTAARGGG